MTYNITTPSEFNSALVERLAARLPGIAVESYDEWGPVDITEPCVLVQWEDAQPGHLRPDGRYQHLYMLTAHCVVPRSHKQAALVAMDMAAEVERLLHHRNLFEDAGQLLISAEQVGLPTVLNNGDTTFLLGLRGLEARGVQWQQPLYLGPSLFEPSEERGGIRVALNPENADDAGAFMPVR